jgi:predicted Zn finger-like uncharacterized protein
MSYAVCPKCGRRYTLRADIAGKAVKCGKCGQAFQAPAAAAEPIASPVIRSNISDLLDELPLESPPPPVEVEAAAPRGTTAPQTGTYAAASWRTTDSTPSERKILGTTDKQWLSGATTLLVIGVGSQILPHFGLQFAKLADMPAHLLPLGGLLFTLGGCAALLVALRQRLKVVLSAVGGVLAVFAIAYSLSAERMAGNAQAVADLRAAADQVLDGFRRVEMVLGRIQDARSVQAALPALHDAVDRLDAGTRRVNELESKGVRLADGPSYLQQLEAIGQRLKVQAERIAAIPGCAALQPEMLRMAHLGEGPASAPPPTPETPAPHGPAAVAQAPLARPSPAPSPSPAPAPAVRPDLPRSKPPLPEARPPELVLPKPQPPKPQTFAGHRSGKSFESKAPQGGLLIGMQVIHFQIGSHVEVKAIQPLYLVDGRPVPDARFGGGGQSKTVAKPGYAVGGMRATVGAVVHGVQFVYMRIKGKQLDPRDSYDSEWLGSNQRGGEQTVIGRGRPVLGIFGSYGTFLNGLGFLVPTHPASKRGPSSPQGERSGIVGATRETSFEDAAPEGGLLVGAQAAHGDFAGIPVLESLQPIYLVGEEQVRGKRCGFDPGSSRSIAKDGYAVGAIKARTGLGIAGLQLVYMRISGNRLDPQDSYESEILGGSEGGDPIVLGGDGRPLAGLQGTYQRMLNGLGLLDTAP